MSANDELLQPEVAPHPPAAPPPAATRLRLRLPVPWATWSLLAINLAVYLYGTSLTLPAQAALENALAHDRGAVARGELWRVFTALFLHTMPLHLAMNMLGLLALGRLLEPLLGHWRYLLIYLCTGLASGLSFQGLSEARHGMGASGAVYGLLGCLLLMATCARQRNCLVPPPRFFAMLLLVLVSDYVFAVGLELLLDGIGVCTSAHGGGMVAGALFGYLVLPARGAPRRQAVGLKLAVSCVLALAITGLALSGFTIPDDDGGRAEAIAAVAELQRKIPSAPPDELLEDWRRLPALSGEGRRMVGYSLYEALAVRGLERAARELLGELAEQAGVDLRRAVAAKDVTPSLLNEVAWYHALDGTRLDEALEYAALAVRLVREARTGGVLDWLPAGRRLRVEESQYVNTRGWVHLLRGEESEALADLELACKLHGAPANYVYLALAHDQLGATEKAREAARQARAAGTLSPYEERLLAQIDG